MHRKMHTVAAAVAAALASTTAFGADWELNPRIEAGYMIDDNYRLNNPGAEIEVQGPLADAQLEMRARMPQSEFSFTPRVRATYFPSEQDLDTVDYFGALEWKHRWPALQTRRCAAITRNRMSSTASSRTPKYRAIPASARSDLGDSGRALRGQPAHAQRAAAQPPIRNVGAPVAGIRR